ncbi:MAG TPA: DHH family phosphoesterase [Methanoculleus sp.]|nr:DHH family phosphoesterase [Methanoculleus sp.]
MSLDAAAGLVARRLLDAEFVEVYGHHDADGIAAASILCQALAREDIRFRLRIRARIAADEISDGETVLLCDFGSSVADLPAEAVVVDHHVPSFRGTYHVNPRLAGIDGDRELSASGTAFLVAGHMADNRDLAGLALLGILGDGQEFAGKNYEILSDGIANGFIEPRRGLRLAGRDRTEQLACALSPYLEGISGNEEAAEEIGSGDDDTLISRIILAIAPAASAQAMCALYGDRYELEREVVHDAHNLCALVDACGQAGYGGLAASLCFRAPGGVEEAWEIARTHRIQTISAIAGAAQLAEYPAIYAIDNPAVVRGAADALAHDRIQTAPVVVMAPRDGTITVSARCPPGVDIDLESLMRRIAGECGGSGGGHRRRAGAVIDADRADCFKAGLLEAIAA